MKLSLLHNKNIAILWFWAEGKSTLTFLLKHNISEENITILDKNTSLPEEIEDTEINYIWWEDIYLEWLDAFSIIIKSPWISPYHEKIIDHRDKLTSQTEIFFSNYTWKVIWVTATKGKSTTVSVLEEALLEAWINVKLVGNIWKPVLEEVEFDAHIHYDYIIYELSSFMLEWFTPPLEIWVLGNIFRCHVDWHDNKYPTYQKAKCNILEKATHKIAWVVTKDLLKDNNIHTSEITFFGLEWDFTYKNHFFYHKTDKIQEDKDISLLGEHNRVNISWIIAVLYRISQLENRKSSDLYKALFTRLQNFESLPHRIEKVGEYSGITFINDSIATTPDATIAAIKTFHPNIGCIFLWWYDYWFEFSDFAQQLVNHNIQNIVFFPNTWSDIKRELDTLDYSYNFIETKTMKEAVSFAYKFCTPGQVALLSCASPSFSMYKCYPERGEDFKQEASIQAKI